MAKLQGTKNVSVTYIAQWGYAAVHNKASGAMLYKAYGNNFNTCLTNAVAWASTNGYAVTTINAQ